MIPREVRDLAGKVGISLRMVKGIWQRNARNMINGTLYYDINLIKNSVCEERRNQIFNAMDEIDKESTNEQIMCKLLRCSKKLFSIEEIFQGSHGIDYMIVNKIGINNKMLCKSNKYYTYAACHHCYSNVKKIPGNYIVTSPCYRLEEEYNEYRKSSFDMFEIVTFDTEEKLAYYQWEYILFIISILEKANISNYHILVASDSFMTEDSKKILYQMLNKSKIEVTVFSPKYQKNIPVASINFHRKNFISKFNLTEDVSYDSMCFGIGIDRLKNIILEYSH